MLRDTRHTQIALWGLLETQTVDLKFVILHILNCNWHHLFSTHWASFYKPVSFPKIFKILL